MADGSARIARRFARTLRVRQLRWCDAERLLADVHAMAQEVMPYDDGCTLLEWAIVSLNAGQVDRAGSHASQAREFVRRLGAWKQHGRALQMLAEIDELRNTG